MEERVKLISTNGTSEITVNNTTFSIGRSLNCDHVVDSLEVSRFHCVIKKIDNKWFLYDRSTNGTFVNAVLYHFNEYVELKSNDRIKLGSDKLEYVFMNDSKESCKNAEDDNTVILISDELPPPENIPDAVLMEEISQEFQQSLEPVEVEVEAGSSEVKPEADSCQAAAVNEQEQNFNIMESELTCSICSEPFIKAVTLNCSHTYCKYCINEWKKNKPTCPICRVKIKTISPTLVLDNFIEKILESRDDNFKESRQALIKQRESVPASSNAIEISPIIEISGDEDDYDNFDDYNDSNTSDFDYESDDEYNGLPGVYYGGYGSCYICRQRGHWANGCPLNPRRRDD